MILNKRSFTNVKPQPVALVLILIEISNGFDFFIKKNQVLWNLILGLG